jgi:hypothetical protein
MLSNPTASYVGCYQDNSTTPAMTFVGGAPTSGGTASGTYSYSQCQEAATMGGYQYFALQNVNTTNGLGYCAVSNSETSSTQYGNAYVPTGTTALWSSSTEGQTGNSAILTVSGALSVINSSGTSVFSTPNSAAQPSSYLGCYGDNPNRAMSLYNGGSQQYNLQQCQQIAQQNGSAYFGLQNSTSGTEYAPATTANISFDLFDIHYSQIKIKDIPFEFNPLQGVALGLPLFIGLRILKKRVKHKSNKASKRRGDLDI